MALGCSAAAGTGELARLGSTGRGLVRVLVEASCSPGPPGPGRRSRPGRRSGRGAGHRTRPPWVVSVVPLACVVTPIAIAVPRAPAAPRDHAASHQRGYADLF